ncbi:hypothetical protein VOLCADRAFT_118024, partial [Volvox carteri f. nagariensis]
CTAFPSTPGALRLLAYVGVAQSASNDTADLGFTTCTPGSLTRVVRDAIAALFSSPSPSSSSSSSAAAAAAGPGLLPSNAWPLSIEVHAQVTSCSGAVASSGAPPAAGEGLLAATQTTPTSSNWTQPAPSSLPAAAAPANDAATIITAPAIKDAAAAAAVAGAAAGAQGIITDAAHAFSDLVPAGELVSLRDLAAIDGSFSFGDILPPLRRKLALGEVGGAAVVPLDAPVLLLVYRRDVLAKMGREIPRTWDELADLVELYGISRPAGAPSAALCATTGEPCSSLSLFSAIWHSLAQSRGLSQGVYFDRETAAPLVRTAAFRAAAQLFLRLWRPALPQPDGMCGFVHPGLRLGTCAFSVGTFEQVKDVARIAPSQQQPPSDTAGQNQSASGVRSSPDVATAGAAAATNANALFGVAQLPGSRFVLSPEDSSRLVLCSTGNCPLGDISATGAGQQQQQQQEQERRRRGRGRRRRHVLQTEAPSDAVLVNRAPYIPSSLLVAGISTRSTTAQRLLAWYSLSHVAGPEGSLQLLREPGANTAPFRTSHFSAAARAAWAAAGYDGDLMGRALDEQQAALAHPNLAWGLHMAGGAFYRSALSDFLAELLNTASSSPSAATDQLDLLIEQLHAKLCSHYNSNSNSTSNSSSTSAATWGASITAARYAAFLNIGSWPRLEAQAGGPATEPAGAVSAPASGSGRGRLVPLAVALIVAGLAVLAVALYVPYRRGCGPLRRRQRPSWSPDAPAVSPNTTLLITDIESSTKLWEELPEVVMGCALRLHHACLRKVLVRHRGYESATEGDSFILAFHKPETALAFAVETQQELLEVNWPPELLANEACAPVYTSAPVGFPFRRPATLETVLSRMSMRPHSHTSIGGGGGAASGPCAFAASPSTLQLLASMLPASFARATASRGSMAPQSPTLLQGRLHSPFCSRQRMSIDMGLLHHLSREEVRTPTSRGDILETDATFNPLFASTQVPLAASPSPSPSVLRRGAERADAAIRALTSMPLASTAAAAAAATAVAAAASATHSVTPTATTAEVAAAALSAHVPASRGSTSSRLIMARLSGRSEMSDLAAAGGSSSSPPPPPSPPSPPPPQRQQPQGLVPPRKPGALSRKLQELQRGAQQQPLQPPQQVEVLHHRYHHFLTQSHHQQSQQQQQQSQQQPSPRQHQLQLMEEQFAPASSMNSSGAWAIIHGGETAAALEDPTSTNTNVAAVTAATAAIGCVKNVIEVMPEYVSAPLNLLPTTSTSRTPTGSGMAAPFTSGGNGIIEPGVDATSVSEGLFEISHNGSGPALNIGAGNRARHASPSQSPGLSMLGGRGERRGTSRRAQTQPVAVAPGRSPLPTAPGGSPELVCVTGGTLINLEACTLEESLKAAIRHLDEAGGGDCKRRLLWRGLRIRMGLHSGIASESELTHNRASARTVYSGECASIVRLVSDSAQGGLILLSGACWGALMAAAAAAGGLHGAAAEALLINIGRYRVMPPSSAAAAGGPVDHEPAGVMPLYIATSPELAARAAVLPPPRKISAVGLSLYAAPVGRVAVASLNVADVGALREWDEQALRQGLALLRRTVLEQLACHRGYLVSEDWEQGTLSVAFAFPLDAVRWALRCREVLGSAAVDWPAKLLAHELCREEQLQRLQQAVAGRASTGGGGGGGTLTLYGSRSGGIALAGSCTGPPPSPVSGRGRIRTLELATSYDSNTALWTSPSLAAAAAAVAAAAAAASEPAGSAAVAVSSRAPRSAASGGPAGDGARTLSREALSATVERGLQQSYTMALGPRAGSTPADLDLVPTTGLQPPAPVVRQAPAGVAGGSGGSAAATAGVRGRSPTVHGTASGVMACHGSYRRRSGKQLIALGSQGALGSGAAIAASIPAAGTTLTGSGLVATDSGSVSCTTATTAGITPKPSGYLSTKFAALSSRLRISAGGGSHADGGGGGGGGGGTAAALSHSHVPAATAAAEAGMLSARASGAADATARSSGAGSPGGPRDSAAKTSLAWALRDEMEDAEDGGDIFSLHLGGMDGCGLLGRAPGVSLSGGCAIYGSSTGREAAAVVAGGASVGGHQTAPAVADRRCVTTTLRGPRIRVGVDSGPVEWGISSSHHCLTYSGAPTAMAEKLAAVAAPGQVLATYSVMLELYRMQANLGPPSEAEEATAAAERGSRAGFGSGGCGGGVGGVGGSGAFSAVVGTALPPPSGRSGLTSGRQRRQQQIFACRFTNDWEEALREYDTLMAQQAGAYQAAATSGWSSPRSGRMSPFSSPWNWSATGRRSKRPSGTAAGAAAVMAVAPPPPPLPSPRIGESRHTQPNRGSFDLFGRGSTSLTQRGAAAQPPLPQRPTAQCAAADALYGSGGGAGVPSPLPSSMSHPLPSAHAPAAAASPREYLDGRVVAVAAGCSREFTSAGLMCCPPGGPSRSGDGRSSGNAAGRVVVGNSFASYVSMSAPSNALPPTPPPPPQQQQRQQQQQKKTQEQLSLLAAAGGALAPAPLTYIFMPPPVAVELNRPGRTSSASWRTLSAARMEPPPSPPPQQQQQQQPLSTSSSQGTLAESCPWFCQNGGAGGAGGGGAAAAIAFPVGSMDDSISLSLRHQLPADVKRTPSRATIASGTVAGGPAGAALLSSTPEHEEVTEVGDVEEEFELTPRTLPRPLPPTPPHQTYGMDPPTSEFASGLVGAVMPAVRTAASATVAAAAAASNSPSASIGSTLPSYPRSGPGAPYGSTGEEGSSSAGGGGGGGGFGSGGSSSASGMLQQALRQHQSYARRRRQQRESSLQHDHVIAAAEALAVQDLSVSSHSPLHQETSPRLQQAALATPTPPPQQQPPTPLPAQPPPQASAIPVRSRSGRQAAAGRRGGGDPATGTVVWRASSTITGHGSSSSSSWPLEVTAAAQQGYRPASLGQAGTGTETSDEGAASAAAAAAAMAAAARLVVSKSGVTAGGREQAGKAGAAAAVPAAAVVLVPASAAPATVAGFDLAGATGDGSRRPYSEGCSEGPPCADQLSSPPGLHAPADQQVLPIRTAVPVQQSAAQPAPYGGVQAGLRWGRPDVGARGGCLAATSQVGEAEVADVKVVAAGEECAVVAAAAAAAAAAATLLDGEVNPAVAASTAPLKDVRSGGSALAQFAAAISQKGHHTPPPPPPPPAASYSGLQPRRTGSGAPHQQRNLAAYGDDSAEVDVASELCGTFECRGRWRRPTHDGAIAGGFGSTIGSSGISGGGGIGSSGISGGGGGGRSVVEVGSYVGRAARSIRALSLQGSHGGAAAAGAAGFGSLAGSSNRWHDTAVRASPTCRTSMADRTTSNLWYMQPQPMQLQRCGPLPPGAAVGGGGGGGGDVSLSPFLSPARFEVYEPHEYGGVSDDCDDRSVSVRAPAGWRPGIHPPPSAGGGSLPPPRRSSFARVGSLAPQSESVSMHGGLQSAVTGLTESSAGVCAGNRAGGGYGISTRGGGGGGGGGAIMTLPCGSACTLSLVRGASACYALDEPELWQDEAYTDPLEM